MRHISLVAFVILSACASSSGQGLAERSREDAEYVRSVFAKLAADTAAAEAALTPAERAQRDRDRALAARENSLLEDALSGRPDYVQALRRAAEANISESNPVVRQSRAAREARIDAEVARLSDVVEKRRRERLAVRAANEQASQAAAARAQARAACDAQASAVGAGVVTPYRPSQGVLGSAIVGSLNSSMATEEARQGCYRAYGL